MGPVAGASRNTECPAESVLGVRLTSRLVRRRRVAVVIMVEAANLYNRRCRKQLQGEQGTPATVLCGKMFRDACTAVEVGQCRYFHFDRTKFEEFERIHGVLARKSLEFKRLMVAKNLFLNGHRLAAVQAAEQLFLPAVTKEPSDLPHPHQLDPQP